MDPTVRVATLKFRDPPILPETSETNIRLMEENMHHMGCNGCIKPVVNHGRFSNINCCRIAAINSSNLNMDKVEDLPFEMSSFQLRHVSFRENNYPNKTLQPLEPLLKKVILVGPTCKIPLNSTQRSCSGIRQIPKMCQEKMTSLECDCCSLRKKTSYKWSYFLPISRVGL